MEFSPLYNLPLWVPTITFIVILSIALEGGYRIGLMRRKSWKDADADSGGGAVVLTSMFALMGLVIAFTYYSGVSRHDARKSAVIIEANALGTAFLKANLVAEPGRTELKTILLDYARTRYIAPHSVRGPADRQSILNRTKKAQAKIWPATMHIIDQGTPVPIVLSLVAAINDVLDAHTIRIVAVFDKLPNVIMWMLVFISAASLGVAGYNAGIQGRMSRWRMTAFSLVLSGLMIVILDYDRPNDGLVIVSQYSIESVITDMEAELGP